MKNNLASVSRNIILFASLLFSFSGRAQTGVFTCADISIASVTANEFDSTTTLINIQLEGSAADFMNYPMVTSVTDCNGNVIATGNLFYFGQFGQSVQGYPVSLINGPICYPITAEFIFGDMNLVNDTCQLTYAGPVSSIGEMDSNSAHAFYNSSLKEIQITSNSIIGIPYSLYNSTGQLVKSGTCSSTISRIGLEGYSTGIYILQMGKEKRFRFLVN
jgi:hypothetical protein